MLLFKCSAGTLNAFHDSFKSRYARHKTAFLEEALGEQGDTFKNPVMLQRLAELDKTESTEKSHTLYVLDGFIKSVKLKNIAAQ